MVLLKKRIRYHQHEAIAGWLLALPAILGFFFFYLGPMLASLILGLTDWKVGRRPNFVGIGNFVAMFTTDPFFWQSLKVTTYYTVTSVPIGVMTAFAVALLLNLNVRGQRIFRTIFYFPTIVPAVANAVLWMWIFNTDFGLLNFILSWFGIPPQRWLFSIDLVIPSLVLMSLWGLGGSMVVFLAGLQGVPAHLYDAVAVDGGNAWDRFRAVTLPMMTPVLLFNLVLGLIGAFQAFTQVFIMTEGGPANASLFYVYSIWRTAFQFSEMGFACALAWVLFLIIAAVTALVFRSTRWWVYYEGAIT
ncbi:MAG: sugar ABC transporter permease [Anaerolineae bacterium]|nr:sugar ABC transporter permease [Anaerolineae bacterium]